MDQPNDQATDDGGTPRDQVQALFLRALRLPPGARESFVRDADIDDAGRTQLRAMLRHADQSGTGDPLHARTGKIPFDAVGGSPGDFATAHDAIFEAKLPERVGTNFDGYTLAEEIGIGGYGVVYAAEQREPARRVAVKIIKLGMDTRQVLARFEQERQALAMMDHPGIARVYDAGSTPAGKPYFVMELVDGDSITAFADEHKLSIRERLELLIMVCDAVQHAHYKGIIHRDIKPRNVLAWRGPDGETRVKLIDFGVAKATQGKLISESIESQMLAPIGTFQYMSPEQCGYASKTGTSPDVDTRADVYALGVLLYELLTGTTPIDPAWLQSLPPDVVMAAIRTKEPPAPSAAVLSRGTPPPPSTISAASSIPRVPTVTDATPVPAAGALPPAPVDSSSTFPTPTLTSTPPRGNVGEIETAAKRSTDPAHLSRSLRGELDWITLKALEKDRTRRYESAKELAADIKRYLAGEAVQAGRPSRVYQARKFVKRNRVQVLAGGAVMLALVVGFGATLGYANEAAIQRDAAKNEAKRADDNAAKEKTRAKELNKVIDFVAQTFLSTDPRMRGQRLYAAGVSLKEDLQKRFDEATANAKSLSEEDRATERETFVRLLARINGADAARALIDNMVLTPSAKAVSESFKGQPLVAASLQQVLSEVYRDLGFLDAAIPLQEAALETRRRELGAEDRHTLASLSNMGMLLQSKGKFAETESYWREVLEKRRRELGEDDADTIMSISNLGGLLQYQNKFAEAELYLREALEKSRRVLGEENPYTLTYTSNLANLLQAQGQLTQAEGLYRELLEKCRRTPSSEHPNTPIFLANMGGVLYKQGKVAEAEQYLREALKLSRRALGEEHQTTLNFINTTGGLLFRQGKLAEAEPYLREASEKSWRVLGERHPDTLGYVQGLIAFYTAWHDKEPGKGYDTKAAEWKAKLDAAKEKQKTPAPAPG